MKNKTALNSEKNGEVLTPQQESFCQEYIKNKGNGTDAVMKIGNYTSRNAAGVTANEYLRMPKILARINDLVDQHIMTDEEADFELQKVARQDAELGAKVKALTERNKLKGRYELHNKQKQTTVVINTERKEEIENALEEI